MPLADSPGVPSPPLPACPAHPATRSLRACLLGCALLLPVLGAAPSPATALPAPAPAATAIRWLPFPGPALELRGLPWFAENAPELWRLPKSAKGQIPPAVWRRGVAADGARIRLSSTTTRLFIRVQTLPAQAKPCFIDAYAGQEFAGAARVLGVQPAEFALFTDRATGWKDLTIYLPNNHEVRVLAVGIDDDAQVRPPPAFAQPLPLVCYGSSVLQGTGAAHPGQTYPAAVARRLNLDFVNLGFGGAGKSEPAVVDLVNQLEAACFLFDLGKSYGNQTGEPYAQMLATIRRQHPQAPLVCVTPIYSTKEPNEPDYREKSERLRTMMRRAALERREAGDPRAFAIEGLDLFGPADQALFRDPQHPNDEGNERIAERLAPLLARILAGKTP